jgi:hypothetical protein
MEEAFFVPCTRIRDRIRARNDDIDDDDDNDVDEDAMAFEEVELRAGAGNVGGAFFHHPDLMFAYFWQLTRSKIVWLGPDIFVEALDDLDLRDALYDVRKWFGYETLFSVRPVNSLDTGRYNELQVCSRSVTDATTTVCDYLFQLMTRSNTIWTHLGIHALPSVSTGALSQFLNNSRRSVGTICVGARFDLALEDFSEDQLRVYLLELEVSAGPHHRIKLRRYTEWSQQQTVIVTNFLQRCQCAIALTCFNSGPSPMLDALRGDCNIVELYLNQAPDIDGLVRALAENKSLVRLGISYIRISDDNWVVLCQSLTIHPNLEFLHLTGTFPFAPNQRSNENKTRRTNVFLEMLRANAVLQELDAERSGTEPEFDEFDERLEDVIKPYFRHLQHVRAFGQHRGPVYAQVLARALNKVDDTLAWMLVRSSIPTILEFREGNEDDIVLDT